MGWGGNLQYFDIYKTIEIFDLQFNFDKTVNWP